MGKYEIPIRIRVLDPVDGVTMQVQRGKCELLSPVKRSRKELVFEFPMTADISGDMPNFLGAYAQGPRDSRFVYVNSGSYAGQTGTSWNRRAKLTLMDITRRQIEEIVNSANKRLEVSFEGTGRDGGPTCASVKGVEWKVVEE